MGERKVFVTGASGMVGYHLVQFLLERDYSVVGCVRQTSKKERLLELMRANPGRFELVIAALNQKAKLAEFMSGCDIVVHTAASIQAIGGERDLYQVNVGGTGSALSAAITTGVKHFIHISSLSVITGEEDRYAVTEEEPLKYCREPYANSKIDAERIVLAESSKHRIAVTALRPGFIYGPNERTWMPQLINALRSRTAMLVGNEKKETNVIYVGNLCRAIELAMLNPMAFGQVYNLTDGQLVTKRALFDTMCDHLGIARVKLVIPTPVARLLVESVSSVGPFAPAFLKGALSRYSRAAFRLVAINQGFDISKAERELNYTQRISFAEGMARTIVRWKAETSENESRRRHLQISTVES
jgi:nucleoside-diphosphate-sugar epimerase